MIERGEYLRFAHEARATVFVTRKRLWQHFERYVAMELGVVRSIDLAHAASAYRREDRVRPETGNQARGTR